MEHSSVAAELRRALAASDYSLLVDENKTGLELLFQGWNGDTDLTSEGRKAACSQVLRALKENRRLSEQLRSLEGRIERPKRYAEMRNCVRSRERERERERARQRERETRRECKEQEKQEQKGRVERRDVSDEY